MNLPWSFYTLIETLIQSGTLLESLAYIAQIVTALTLVVAVMEFLYRRSKDKRIDEIELVSFFRNIIAPAYWRYYEQLRPEAGERNLALPFIGAIETFSYEWIYTYATEKFEEQEKITMDAESRDLVGATKSFSDLANAMEEFALRVLLVDAVDSAKLNSVRATYAEIVEMFAYRIAFSNLQKDYHYPNIITLYMYWRTAVDRQEPEKRIKQKIHDWMQNLAETDPEAYEKIAEVSKRRYQNRNKA